MRYCYRRVSAACNVLMCGVAALLDPVHSATDALPFLRHRGPDAEGSQRAGLVSLAHTRLAILDLDPRSDQPFTHGRTTVSYNGELWNYRAVRADLEACETVFHTTGDTEVVAAAFDRWGPAALPRLDGMFAVAWTSDGTTLHLARDRFGEVPLHRTDRAAASEIKALLALGARAPEIVDVGPGEHVVLRLGALPQRTRWYDPSCTPARLDLDGAALQLRTALEGGCRQRAISDAPVCTLLSGGLDSAAVAALLRPHRPDLVCYTAVMDRRSPDLRAAREVADHLGLRLVEVEIAPPTADDLASVVRAIEMPHKAQVEIGWACLALARRMHADGFKVTFSGEGSDELWASYGFAYHGLKTADWHAYRKALFLGQHRKNFARCNKVFLTSAVECRLPFLHPPLVELALSLRQDAVQDGRARPKAVLQRAVADLLPRRIINRPKLAFQDGLGLKRAAAEAVARPEVFYRAEHAALSIQRARRPVAV